MMEMSLGEMYCVNVLDESDACNFPFVISKRVGEHICLRFDEFIAEEVVVFPIGNIGGGSNFCDCYPADDARLFILDGMDLDCCCFESFAEALFFILSCEAPLTLLAINEGYIGKAHHKYGQ